MKNMYKLLFAIILSFSFITSIDAANFDFKLSCPATALVNQNVDCTISALVTEESIKKLDVNISRNNLITFVGNSLDTSIQITSNYTNIGKLNFKTTGSSGKANISVTIKPTTASNAVLASKTKSATITVKNNNPSPSKSSVNTLNNLKIDGQILSDFSKDKTSYTLNTSKSSVTISASSTSSKASVTGTGTKSLKCGTNNFTVTVKSESGSKKSYNLKINRTCNQSVYLKNIEISVGNLKPGFNKDITNYTIEVDNDVETITVNGIKSSSDQVITGNVTNKKLVYGSNKISITVSNSAGDKKVYTVNVVRKDNRDANTYLSSLSLSSGEINFNKNTFSYETKVLFDVENIEVFAIPEKETSEVIVTGNKNLKVGENTINIKVKSESNQTKDYIIKVTRLEEGETFGDNAFIKNITIKGYDLKFDSKKKEYKLVIDKEDKLDIKVSMVDPNVTYEIIGNKDLKDGSVIKIVTKSSDGSTETYLINIIKNSYAIYYVIAILVLLVIISIPVVIYFKVVKGKKKELDVNGYEIGKGYEQQDYSRKVIGNNFENNNFQNNVNDMNLYNNYQNYDYNNQNNINNVGNNFQDYVSDQSSEKCPNCGRELLGMPNECPYCKMILR